MQLRYAAIALLPSCVFSQSLIDYDRQVHPILAEKCWSCHSQEKRSGGLSLGTHADLLDGGRNGAAVKPGSAASSLLLRRVTGEVAPRMPLGHPPLSDERDRDSAHVDRSGRACDSWLRCG